jgi:amino acid adenylation domain-containing protein
MKTEYGRDNNPYENFTALTDILLWRGANESEKIAYNFLADGENEQLLTYGDLDRKCKAIGGFLQSIGSKGDRVLLFFNPGLDYITAFFGCLYAGMIAVPSYPPKINREAQRVDTILKDAGASIVLTTDFFLSKLDRMIEKKPSLKELHWINVHQIAPDYIQKWEYPASKREDVCYLQYTSGSTADPKGVMVSHGNLMHNLDIIRQHFENTRDTRAVVWLPPYHDMGLIGGIMEPIFVGFPVNLMSPFTFLEKPLLWLKAISRYRANCSGGPNFAYELCIQRISEQERESLDLSCWNLAFNGAEPVRPETIERFAREFAVSGFRKEAFYPCYGLAEATLFVTGGRKTDLPKTISINEEQLNVNQIALDHTPKGKTLIGSGKAYQNEKVLIVNPDTNALCPVNQVGEIWVKSESIARGYWKKEEETKRTFNAYIGDDGDGPFLRTGDLGFINDGELYVTGRVKDLIIIRGKNHYPHDIELTVENSHEALQPGSGAAFSIEIDGAERLVIIQEVKRTYRNPNVEEIGQAVRTAVFEAHEIQVYALVLIPMMSLPKTTSGKIQRQLSKKKYLNNEFRIIGESRIDGFSSTGAPDEKVAEDNGPAESSEADALIISTLGLLPRPEDRRLVIGLYLKKKIAAILRINESRLDEVQPLSSFGFDSLMTVDLAHKIETVFGVVIPMAQILEGMNLAELSLQIANQFDKERQKNESANEKALPLNKNLKNYLEGVPLPLSRGQQGLWFLHQMDRENVAYNLAYAVRINQALNADHLKESFAMIVKRHPALQAVFKADNSQLFQVCKGQDNFHYEERELTDSDLEGFDAELNRLAVTAFDLENGPLLKVYHFKKSETESILLLVIHHIIADFWSLGILIKEFGQIYRNLSLHRQVNLPLPKSSYFDYIEEQQALVQKNPKLEEYWKENLGGELPVLNLPTDYTRPAVQTYNGGSCYAKFDGSKVEKLKALCNNTGSTTYMKCLAAFYILLWRYTGQDDLIIGSPTAGRISAAYSDVIGYFINPVAIRLNVDNNPSFSELLAQVKEVTLKAFEHQDYPFDLIVEKLQIQRDLSRSPIFQAMFSYQKAHDTDLPTLASFALNETKAKLNIDGLSMELIPLKNQIAQFDLSLTAAELEDGLGLSIQYNRDLFKEETIAGMLNHLLILLDGIIESPEKPISELPLFSSEELERILNRWNDTKVDYEKTGIHHLIEAQAAKNADAPAVIYNGETLTYKELNEKANQLARYLRRSNPDNLGITALFIDRSLELVIGLLGILKAGGSYLPLDPIYPKERISYILTDAAKQGHPPLVITQKRMLANLPSHEGKVICIDDDWDEIAQEKKDNLEISVDAEGLAYVIYTSGTTGNPKGVMISHRAVVNFLNSMSKKPGLTSNDVMLSVTTISFDIAALEIFLPLITGARIVLASFEKTISGNLLAEEIEKNQVTVMQATPSVYRLLLDSGWKGSSRLKILCGGEAFPPNLVGRLLPIVKEIWNMYGPTETTIWSTVYQVRNEAANIPVGRPIDNTQIYILDQYLKPTPVGVAGELYIGGDGIAHGYFQNDTLTKERFIPNPFKPEGAGDLIYKTGDLAYYLPDGLIKVQGRTDFQIKLHGHRIEIGEIESILSKHPAVREVVIVLREDNPNDKMLVAYIVAGDETPNVTDLRNFLKEKLPEYMVPSIFMVLANFPKTPNGKIDRKSLPAPEKIRPELNNEFIKPQSELEQVIAGIWSENLNIDKVGIYDNFFDLGGSSVKMAQIYQQLSKALPDKEFSIVDLFQYPTVHSLSQHLIKNDTAVESKREEEEKSAIRRQRRANLADAREARRNLRS